MRLYVIYTEVAYSAPGLAQTALSDLQCQPLFMSISWREPWAVVVDILSNMLYLYNL